MKIVKFEGATMRDAIAKVKAELGDQAVIISTRQVRRGLLGTAIEISAAIEDDDTRIASGPITGGPLAPTPASPPLDVEQVIGPLRSELRSLRALVRSTDNNRGTNELRSEVAALRKLVSELTAASTRTATSLEPAEAPADDATERARQATAAATRALARKRPALALTRPSTGNVLMFVGPTGAGKTTTIAKLAARAALIDGRRVKLVTLDTYRVGGIEQIRTFADLIGIPLDIVEEPHRLGASLSDDYDLILIDTAGRSPRETAPIEELAAIPELPTIEVHVVIPAATGAPAIDALLARYRALSPARLLFTKLDEVEHAPELANAPGRANLPITWVTTGQDVPEDIEEPTSTRVLELARTGLSLTSNRGAA